MDSGEDFRTGLMVILKVQFDQFLVENRPVPGNVGTIQYLRYVHSLLVHCVSVVRCIFIFF